MITKCFVITEFGKPFEWTQKYIDQLEPLAKNSWRWLIFTPNPYKGNSACAVIPMDIQQFNELCQKTLGVNPNMFITQSGVPSLHITDFYVFTGRIFAEYLKGMDYWGITNMDVVYGNLSTFLPDEELQKYDIWTDDVKNEKPVVNGVFSLWKNIDEVNNLCYKIPNWREKLTTSACPKCSGTGDGHHLFGTDEIDMVPIVQWYPDKGDQHKVGCPKHYPMHSYDRLIQHYPVANLKRFEDNSLWERFVDMAPTSVLFGAREIPYFHFSYTKQWPIIAY